MPNSIYPKTKEFQHNPLIPVSFVRDVHDNGSEGWTLDINHEIPWIEFGVWLERYSRESFNKKEDAPLFSPTVYNGTRNSINATTSRLLVLDSDGGLALPTMMTWLRDNQIESIIYNSARHKNEEVGGIEKFRVIILLDQTIDTPTQGKAVRALARALCEEFQIAVGKGAGEWDLDPTRLNAHSLLYVPGQYAQAGETIFEHIGGDPLDPFVLIEGFPEPETEPKISTYEPRDHQDDDADMIEQKAEAAIRVIRNDFADRGTWIKIGQALKAAFANNDGRGFSLWESFSHEWPGNTQAVIEREWKSFNPHKINPTTLFYHADQDDPSWRDQFRPKPEPWKHMKGVMSLTDMLADLKESPTNDNDDDPISDAEVKARKRFYSSADCMFIPPPLWIVKGLIPENADTAIYGPSGTLKSFVALDLALSIATALQAFDRLEIKEAMPVIYFAGEGFNNMAKKRQVAWQIHHGLSPYTVENFWLVDGVPLTNEDDSIDADIKAIKAILKGRPLGLLVIDTLSRALNGQNENEANSASVYFSKLKQIRDAVGGTSLTIGHFGKDLDRGERGSSGFRASYDTVIWIEKHSKDEETGVHTIQLFVVKQKDADDGMRIWLQSQKVPLPPESTDDPNPCSLVLVPITEHAGRTLLAPDSQKKKKANQQSFEQEVEEALHVLTPGGGHISTNRLAKYLAEKHASANMTDAETDKMREGLRSKLRAARREGLRKFAVGESDWALSVMAGIESLDDMLAELKENPPVPNGQFPT